MFRLIHKDEDDRAHAFELHEFDDKNKATGRWAGFAVLHKDGKEPHLGQILHEARKLPSAYHGELIVAASVVERFGRPKIEMLKAVEARALELFKALEACAIECGEVSEEGLALLDTLEEVGREVALFYGKVLQMRAAKEKIDKAVRGKKIEEEKVAQEKKED